MKKSVRASRPPLERMLRVHEELQRGAHVNCTKLAATMEVSIRTIMRDLEFMRDRWELPIEFDTRRNTFAYTRPVTNLPTVQATEGELVALLVARKALEQYRGTPFHRQLAVAFEKMSAGLRDNVSFTPTDDLRAVSFKNMGLGKADLTVFNHLSRAVVKRFEVEFDYRKPGETKPARRRVRPYHLANRENLWYLIAFDVARGALRTFAVPRIARVSVQDAKFERPTDFSPERFFANALGVLGGERDYRIVIRFSAAVADRVREREWHESQRVRELGGGGVELTLRLGALLEIERWILTWGADAEVVAPEELRERIKATSAVLLKRYR
jgi:proteasome accessory factor B